MTTLLVNPWIYDFAAHDFGMRPLGLLRIGEALRRQGKDVALIDCLAGCSGKKGAYGFSKISKKMAEKPAVLKNTDRTYFRYGISIPEFHSRLDAIKTVEAIYVTSGMTYWYPGVRLAVQILRERYKGAPITLGGIYATLCHEHASRTSGADVIWKGDYLKKETFSESGFHPAYDLVSNPEVLPIQLSRGCPFNCSYCASKMLSSSFELRDPVDLFEEVMRCHKDLGTKVFVFYDDALTYKNSEGIKKFLRLVIASGMRCIFRTPNGLHARYIDDELAYLLKNADFKDIRLSLETSDEAIRESTGAKVTNDDLKRALRDLKEAGFDKGDLGVYLLMGAPWLTIEKTLEDIIFVNFLGAKAVLASYSPIPGTGDYAALVEKGIIPEDLDPLWNNNTVFAELYDPYHSSRIRLIRNLTSKLNRM
ncbi:B12-binding domain-containing radical SAM protein [Candidatus Omnitrophota bacterium]